MQQVSWQDTAKLCRPTNDGEFWRSHIVSSMARGLPEFTPLPFLHDGTMAIVGSGPSMPQYIEEIRNHEIIGQPICAIKGAHDFLMEHGIHPDLFVSVEPRERVNQIQHRSPYTVYYLASHCHPMMFDWLKDQEVVLFHTAPNKSEMPALNEKFLIPGGTTSGLRAVTLAWYLGFTKFVLYGFDSCLSSDGETKRFTGEKSGKVLDRWMNGRRFLCNVAMAMQADEFQEYYKVMPGVTFDVKGDGLLAWIVQQRREAGLPA